MECKLVLKTSLVENINITLTKTVKSNLTLNVKSCGVVYSNMKYSAEIYFEKEIQNIEFYINNRLRKTFYNNGKIYFNDDSCLNDRIFLNYFGYVNITVCIQTSEGNYVLSSDYLDVAVRDNVSSDIVRRMIDYIAKNSQKYLFNEDDKIKDFSNVGESESKDIHTEISMLENIIFEYENNFKYFKVRSKYRVKNNYIVDEFEKLKEIKNETIQYIISNPQYLTPVNYNTCIKYNKLNLQPKKTLINKNELCYDTYENRVIMGFLRYVYNLIIDKLEYIESQNSNKQKQFINDKYISLSNEIYFKINEFLYNYKMKLYDMKKKVHKLYFMYKQVLKCEEIIINKIPKPSAIFMEVQHYKKIYKVIREWFKCGKYDFETEKMLLTFSEASYIYEYYILFKINNYIMERKYSFKKGYKFSYRFSKQVRYVNTKFENTFVFEKENTNITLYYQPVIYFDQIVKDNDIGLFRNNNINLCGETSRYYTPDYVIKITKDGISKFIILDAKWATLETVKKYRFKELIYKYFFSISAINSCDKITKVWAVNGVEVKEKGKCVYNFYNSKFKNRNDVLKPSAKILTLNPNTDIVLEKNALKELLEEIS